MSELYLVVFECASIQRYVFASNRLKEIVGASQQVEQVFVELRSHLKEFFGEQMQFEDKSNEELALKIDCNPSIDAEVLYIGGGNAVVIVRGEDNCKKLIQTFSLVAYDKYPGMLLNAGLSLFDPQNLKDSIENAFAALKANKQRLPSRKGLIGIGVTRECATTGLPAAIRYDEAGGNMISWLSLSSYQKRMMSENTSIMAEEDIFKEEYRNSYLFPIQLEDMGQRQGESHIAIVHIDGNGMGKMLKDYTHDAQQLRKFSKDADALFKNMIHEGINKFIAKWKENPDIIHSKIDFSKRKAYLPLRPLIWGGDDITFICDGRLGLPLAEHMLCFLYKNMGENGLNISACAGVAITKTKFPIARAYNLAEELCKNAKKYAKQQENETQKFWLDFQIIPFGLTGSIDEIRSREFPDHDKKDKQRGLYYRPWRIGKPEDYTDSVKDCYKEREWMYFKKILDLLKNKAKPNQKEIGWSRSRAKSLREALYAGKTAIELFYNQAKLRGCQFYEKQNKSVDFKVYETDKSNPYFDVVEAMDYYIDLKTESEKMEQANG